MHTVSCFNPRPRAGGDIRRLYTSVCSSMFQSTPPRGGDRSTSGHWSAACRVSIHAPARGATPIGVSHDAVERCFNPRPRAGGDSCSSSRMGCPDQCFNPRPRGGRPTRAAGDRASAMVSIHAPARGATLAVADLRLTNEQFQSTPPRGGDHCRRSDAMRSLSFNPRPRGGRRQRSAQPGQHNTVSIHAPARGATLPACVDRRLRRFQSTPPRGGRRWTCQCRLRSAVVSIHAPAGGDHADRRDAIMASCFNPRPRAGGDCDDPAA